MKTTKTWKVTKTDATGRTVDAGEYRTIRAADVAVDHLRRLPGVVRLTVYRLTDAGPVECDGWVAIG